MAVKQELQSLAGKMRSLQVGRWRCLGCERWVGEEVGSQKRTAQVGLELLKFLGLHVFSFTKCFFLIFLLGHSLMTSICGPCSQCFTRSPEVHVSGVIRSSLTLTLPVGYVGD